MDISLSEIKKNTAIIIADLNRLEKPCCS